MENPKANFKEAIILVGPEDCGKTDFIVNLINDLSTDEYMVIPHELIEKFAYCNFMTYLSGNCSQKTKVLIIEKAPVEFDYESLFNLIASGLKIHPKIAESYIIFPRIIITSNHFPEFRGASFNDHFGVFDFVSGNRITPFTCMSISATLGILPSIPMSINRIKI